MNDSNQKTLWIAAGAIGFIVLAGVFLARLAGSGWSTGPDEMFGDQHLKTTVALVELHERRYGRYPETLEDLRFTGEWDTIALTSTEYCTNEAGDAYYVEVTKGWMGDPEISMPDVFWRGTGFAAEVGPCR